MIDRDFEPEKIDKRCKFCGEQFRKYNMDGFEVFVCFCGVTKAK